MKALTPPASASQPVARIALRRVAVRRGSESSLRRVSLVEPTGSRLDADAVGAGSERCKAAAPSTR